MRLIKAVGIFFGVSVAVVLALDLLDFGPVIATIDRQQTDMTSAVSGAIALAASSLATWIYVTNPKRNLHDESETSKPDTDPESPDQEAINEERRQEEAERRGFLDQEAITKKRLKKEAQSEQDQRGRGSDSAGE